MGKLAAILLGLAAIGFFAVPAATAGVGSAIESDTTMEQGASDIQGCIDWLTGDGDLISCLRFCIGNICTIS